MFGCLASRLRPLFRTRAPFAFSSIFTRSTGTRERCRSATHAHASLAIDITISVLGEIIVIATCHCTLVARLCFVRKLHWGCLHEKHRSAEGIGHDSDLGCGFCRIVMRPNSLQLQPSSLPENILLPSEDTLPCGLNRCCKSCAWFLLDSSAYERR